MSVQLWVSQVIDRPLAKVFHFHAHEHAPPTQTARRRSGICQWARSSSRELLDTQGTTSPSACSRRGTPFAPSQLNPACQPVWRSHHCITLPFR